MSSSDQFLNELSMGDLPLGSMEGSIAKPVNQPSTIGEGSHGHPQPASNFEGADPKHAAPGRVTNASHTRKRGSGVIKLVGAPAFDIAQARKQIMEDSQHNGDQHEEGESGKPPPEMADLVAPRFVENQESELLEAVNEESFTLESFESLIRIARASGKAFLLARVTTVDPNNLTHLYYSYYAAHHINKVIFRTEPEEGLLHRMKSRNPLNNMLIVGDVHYFTVAPGSFDEAWCEKQKKMAQRNVLRSSTPSSVASGEKSHGSTSSLFRGVWRAKSLGTKGENSVFGGQSSGRSSAAHNTSSTSLADSLGSINNSADVVDKYLFNMELEDPTVPVVYEAKYFASDDDFLMRADVRDYFKTNSVNPDDYQLFQLHRRSDLPYDLTILGPDGLPLAYGSAPNTRRPSRWRTLGGLLDGGQHRSLVGLRTGFLSPLGFWIIMLLLTGATVIVSLLYLPSPFHYFAFVGLIAVFGITLILFVDWTEDGTRPRRNRRRQMQARPLTVATPSAMSPRALPNSENARREPMPA